MHYVTDRLLVGNADDARNPPLGIEAVLFVAGDYDLRPPSGILFGRIPLVEFGEANPHDVLEAVDWLEEQLRVSRRLMVCCRAGMGRSVSMVIAYLCCVEGMAYTDALALLQARRPGATPLPNLELTIEQARRLRDQRRREAAKGPDDRVGDSGAPAPSDRLV